VPRRRDLTKQGWRNLACNVSKRLGLTSPLYFRQPVASVSERPYRTTRGRCSSPIGRRYGRIFNRYLCLAQLSASSAPCRKHLNRMSTSGLRSCCCLNFRKGKEKKCLSQNSPGAALRRRCNGRRSDRPARRIREIRRSLSGQHGTRTVLSPAGARLATGIHRKQRRPSCPSDGPGPASHRRNAGGRRVRRRAWRRRLV
jgi:hypothetical protein